jgi:tetratricopeptide (TPR) repeat protein
MWQVLSILIPLTAVAQTDFQVLDGAYAALRAKDYDTAIGLFQTALSTAPNRADLRKDLAYTYLKVGESSSAMNEFRRVMDLDPTDQTVALEFAFLSYEAPVDPIPAKARARRMFASLAAVGNQTAQQAFDRVDRPLRDGIDRWTRALEIGPESFSAHLELAQLAEQRDLFDLAAKHYLRAFQLRTAQKSILIDLSRMYSAMGRPEDAVAALVAASRGGEPRAMERARELLPDRYPYVYEFRNALALCPSNTALHRELAYLLLAMQDPAAESEFRNIVESDSSDLLSAAQLALLLLARQDRQSAMPFADRVLSGDDPALALTVRSAIKPNLMAKKSFEAGFLDDALRYLNIAHELDPSDCDVMLRLGWTYNMLHDDRTALHWFELARRSPDAAISAEASKAYDNLLPSVELFRTTAWLLPFYSSRWRDVFSYGQIKTELNLQHSRIRPYVSTRLIADVKPSVNNGALSERSFILGFGVAARWNRFIAWAEAGSAISYIRGSMVPDYRGGLSWSGRWVNENSYFLEANADEVFISRFGNDWLSYLQTRVGYHWFLVNLNLTADTNHQHWASFVEFGPGLRYHFANTPKGLLFSVNLLRGVYLVNERVPHQSNFNDLRVGFWYAITK